MYINNAVPNGNNCQLRKFIFNKFLFNLLHIQIEMLVLLFKITY